MIYSDWHLHSEASYDATLTLKEIAEGAKQRGYVNFGIPVTYGSDSHRTYLDHGIVVGYLTAAGFKDGDIVGISEDDLW